MKTQRIEGPRVQGWLHSPAGKPTGAIALTHGAGTGCDAKLLVAAAEAFCAAGYAVLRYDLPFRQKKSGGFSPAQQQEDREGIRRAAEELRKLARGCPVYLAGHSYGGRQSTMLAAADASVADALMLLSYPLHPPGKPTAPRTEHFPNLRIPALFVHGTRDDYGTPAEMEQALKLIPARTQLRIVEGAPHGLKLPAAAQLPLWLAEFLLV